MIVDKRQKRLIYVKSGTRAAEGFRVPRESTLRAYYDMDSEDAFSGVSALRDGVLQAWWWLRKLMQSINGYHAHGPTLAASMLW
jgi:hypothetical protein